MENFVLKSAAWFARQLPASWKKALYRVKPLAGLLRRTLNTAAPEGLTRVKVAAGGLKGTKLYLNLRTEKDYWLGTYEPELQKAVQMYFKPGMVVYDIGANIGYISLLFLRAVGTTGHVYAFEALPANVERLKQNLIPSGALHKVTVFHAAVINQETPVEFLVHSSTSMGKALGSAGRKDAHYESTIQVPGIALDTFVSTQQLPKPDVIKMDIEGGEVLAIEGMRVTLTTHHPLLLIELHGPESALAVGRVLKDCGYQAYRMENPAKVIDLEHPDHWKAYIIAK
ncbi:MAG: FkbM family methyltransferase [Anaerolineae bacterium]|nr:FkbM family methyltransferase [Anaerolineae bacterium]